MSFVLKMMNTDGTVAKELRFESWEELSAHYEGLLEQEKEGQHEVG